MDLYECVKCKKELPQGKLVTQGQNTWKYLLCFKCDRTNPTLKELVFFASDIEVK